MVLHLIISITVLQAVQNTVAQYPMMGPMPGGPMPMGRPMPMGQMQYPPQLPMGAPMPMQMAQSLPVPMPMSLPPQPKMPLVVMPYRKPKSKKKHHKKRKSKSNHWSDENSSSGSNSDSNSSDNDDSNSVEEVTKRRSVRSGNKRRRQVLTPVISYVTKDGYVVYQKKIKKERAKDWLELGQGQPLKNQVSKSGEKMTHSEEHMVREMRKRDGKHRHRH